MEERFTRDIAAIAQIDAVPMILEVICRTTGLGFAAIARVTEKRWIACAVRDEIAFGLKPGGELEVATTICDEIRDSGNPVVIDEVATDVRFCNHPTPKQYGFQSYISVPIVREGGAFFGTLCAIDPRPARLDKPETRGMFTLFARLIAFHLDSQDRLTSSESALSSERETAHLREQFIAVLGHDLGNPVAAIDATAKVLLRMSIGENLVPLLQRIERSAQRMSALIDNVLDFARGRLGGGVGVQVSRDDRLDQALQHVVAELQAVHPDRVIVSEIAVRHAVYCDSSRIAQLASNLLANALTHGDPERPVGFCATSDSDTFTLWVRNHGNPIAPEVAGRLFHPFWRGAASESNEGLGLGLFIASEIARAHDGTLEVSSTPHETRFTFRMPVEQIAGTRAPQLERDTLPSG